MKHWHRCSRWRKRKQDCPLRTIRGHEDDGDGPDDELRFTESARARFEGGEHGGTSGGSPRVGVREPAFPIPKTREAFGDPPQDGIPVRVLRAFGIPIPATREFGAGSVRFPEEAADAIARMEEARRAVPAGIGETRELFGMLGEVPSIRSESLKDRVAELAEMAAAEGKSRDVAAQLTAVLAVAGASTIPLVREAVRQLRGVRVRPGVLGTPGRADPVRTASTFRSSPGTGPTGHAPRQPAAGAKPVKVGGFAGVGKNFNASSLMEAMVGRSRRRFVAQTKRRSEF